jgi:DNA-binding response OmpR family regulator
MDRQKFVPPLGSKTYELGVEDSLPTTKTILLVEDETMYAELLKEYLESYDYSVIVAPDGVQGLKKVMEKDFDLVICDLLMPNLPGDMFYVAVQRVKPQLAKRFIFITGHQNDPSVAEFVKKTKSLTLFKPFEMHVLLETIMAALKNSNPKK